MTYLKISMIAAAGIMFAVDTMSSAQAGGGDRYNRSREIRENAARGGPQPRGSTSPFMARIQVCKDLPYTKTDPRTGRKVTGTRKSCWFE